MVDERKNEQALVRTGWMGWNYVLRIDRRRKTPSLR
jgi:hypothetical protein